MLNTIISDIEKELSYFLRKNTILNNVNEYAPVLVKNIKEFITRPGKRIRPALVVISYLGYSKTKTNYKKILTASLSLELLHAFLLIHDDIIDNSSLRRGKPTLHKVFNKDIKLKPENKLGSDLAIIAGDIIFALATEALNSLDKHPERIQKALSLFNTCTVSTGVGEFIDVINNLNPLDKIQEKHIYNTNILKTAKYTFEYPMLIGATLAGTKKPELQKLSSLGSDLGEAFQLIDDMLDIFSSPERSGKPVLSDILEGKKTFLIFKTYASLKGKDKSSLKKLFSKENKKKSDLLKIKYLIERSNAKNICFKKASSLLAKAGKTCASLKMKNPHKKVLFEIIQKLNNSLQEFNSET